MKELPNNREYGETINTVDTPGPQEITPPPEAIIASQIPLETDEVAVPVVVEDISARTINPLAGPTAPPKFCTVIAPSTLEAGYSFPARVDDIDFLVTVPEGGVNEGQAFQVPYPKKASQSATGPTSSRLEPLSIEQATLPQLGQDDVMGHWRRPLCECCENCCTECMCFFGFFCTPIMLAQIMTRMRLNVFGVVAQGDQQQTFLWVVTIWTVFLVLFFALITLDSASSVLLCIFGVYYTIASTNVRSTMRRRYNIRAECCMCCDGVSDDCCTSFWCAPCSVIQMARHTHDVKIYPYDCCSKTGGTPEVV
ncbi:PLAC8 family domain containing protein [Nitzschia inconspicua]|uniref:PLAC8 family domain containing protein n=1 Tax=Nitzschia inconspicua TaxID=303405 RepID=A0A9K3LUD6_9STRA|nr:PLAC8 family domain containing protein [Nitzschia inconspicua]